MDNTSREAYEFFREADQRKHAATQRRHDYVLLASAIAFFALCASCFFI